MSKSTFFKRIALAAIAALGFGMLSVAPSQATVTSHTLSIDSATDAATVGDSATAVLTHSFVNLGSAYDSVVISAVITSSNASNAGTLSLTVADSYTSTANTGAAANSPLYSGGNTKVDSATAAYSQFKSTATWATTRDSITIAPYDVAGAATTRAQGTSLTLRMYDIQAAGTFVVSIYTQVSNAGAALTSSTVSATWTVTATAASATATSASTVTLRTGDNQWSAAPYDGTAEGTDSSTVFSAYNTAATDTTPEATLIVLQKNGTSSNTAKESFTVQVTGEAYVTDDAAAIRPTANTGVKWKQFATPTADSEVQVWLWSTGTEGTATVTVATTSGLTLATKSLTFTGAPTTIAVSAQYRKVINYAATSIVNDIVAVKVGDASANGVAGVVTPSIVSSNTAVITGGTCTDARAYGVGSTNSTTADGTFLCGLNVAVGAASGNTATITVRYADPEATTTTYISTTFDVTLGGAPATFTLEYDKATYEPGENMIITATAKDASGNTPYDLASGPSLTCNKALAVAISMDTYIGGVSKSSVYSDLGTVSNDKNLFAPNASGSFTCQGLDGQTTPALVKASATVQDDAATNAAAAASDAALEAIDAANAATDAANLAAEAADAATVAAEEARDAADAATAAVEALASEVATLMAALKAQITTLAKTVAKIAKKVKA